MLVSIPYGTIKRLLIQAMRKVKDMVSIPYGTIKRHTTESHNRRRLVSIPYGTIKSAFCGFTVRFRAVFQFLMVQLKVSTGAFLFGVYLFQFLMVQLKVYFQERLVVHYVVSIPYGTIKS